MTVPYTFGTATTSIPLSNLDANFNTPITLGNTSIYLGNTTTTIGNLTLTNVIISSGTANITSNITYATANAVVFTNASSIGTTSSTFIYDANGNLGVGTNNTGFGASGATRILNLRAGTTAGTSSLTFGDINAVGYVESINGNGILNINAGSYVAFGTGSPTERMRIDSSGNVGIGATPSPWNVGRAIQIGSASDASLWGFLNSAYLSSNAYYNGVWIYNATAAATQYLQQSGEHIWYTAPSGTAASGITFTERMRITSGGTLAVGSTSYGGYTNAKLSVNGGTSQAAIISHAIGSGNDVISCWNAATTGDNNFISFYTEASPTARGSIFYNRAAGLTVYSTTSDQRLKENIVDASSAMSLINSVKIRSFNWIETGNKVNFGVIAQELITVAPEAVIEGHNNAEFGKNPYWQVDTSTLVPAMIKAIQELKAEFDAYKASHP
jgi:hypothetical protein